MTRTTRQEGQEDIEISEIKILRNITHKTLVEREPTMGTHTVKNIGSVVLVDFEKTGYWELREISHKQGECH